MPRVEEYGLDATVSIEDMVFGTDSITGASKNFLLKSVFEAFPSAGAIILNTANIEYLMSTQGNSVNSYRSTINSLIVYSGYLLNSVAIIKKCDNSVITHAVGVSDLETDWANRLSLTYI
tara:strand:+ start:408 stop:767 length:360 start_codon:yes stop_codon:yes gene_type:complete